MQLTTIAYVMSLAALLLSLGDVTAAEPCQAQSAATIKLSFDNPALLPSVHATINGSPAILLLDTGSDLTLLSKRMPLPPARFSSGSSIGGFLGKTRLRKVQVEKLTVGPIELRNITLPAEQSDSAISAHWDGILGADHLLRYDLDISFADSSITLYPAGSCAPAWTAQAHAISLLKQGNSLIPRMAAIMGAQSSLAVVDTGANASIVLRQFLTAGQPDVHIAVAGKKVAGFGGESASIGTAPLKGLALGGQRFPDAIWHVVEQNREAGDDGILIGGDFFAANKVFISSTGGVLHFQAYAAQASDPFQPNTSWYQTLAQQGNLAAQLKLVELSSTLAERLQWQKMAAEQGHIGSLVALAVQARAAGGLPEATEYVSRALQRDAKSHQV